MTYREESLCSWEGRLLVPEQEARTGMRASPSSQGPGLVSVAKAVGTQPEDKLWERAGRAGRASAKGPAQGLTTQRAWHL